MKNKTLKSLLIYGLGITTTLGTMIPTISSCGSKKSNDVISGYCVLEVNKESKLKYWNNSSTTSTTPIEAPNLQYAWYSHGKIGNWQQINLDQEITLEAKTTYLLKGDNPNGWNICDTKSTDTPDDDEYSRQGCIKLTNATDGNIGNIKISGSILGLLNQGNKTSDYELHDPYIFADLFEDSNAITSISDSFLKDVKTLSERCYAEMFNNCENLKTAPILYSTKLDKNCYYGMFRNCINLEIVPLKMLPATTLSYACYSRMFNNCTKLKNTPNLPATTIDQYVYHNMFNGCTSLVNTVSTLPALEIAYASYNCMYEGCTSLQNPPKIMAETIDNSSCRHMFYNCSKLTTTEPYLLKAKILAPSCYQEMFYGCVAFNSIGIAYQGLRSNAPTNAFDNWVAGVSSNGTFYYTGLDTDPVNDFGFPSAWQIQNYPN